MGPFKHTVDDGLDLRKAAFECMYTLLETCLDRLEIFEFLNHVEDGLKDHYDIKVGINWNGRFTGSSWENSGKNYFLSADADVPPVGTAVPPQTQRLATA